jgi:hypothetical protein
LADAILLAGLHERIPTATFPTNQTKDTPIGCSRRKQGLKIAMVELIDFFQKQAQECRSLATQVRGKDDLEYWLRLAQRWEWLAQQNAKAKVKIARPTTPTRSVLEKRFAKRSAP